jgi:hypothetical protein
MDFDNLIADKTIWLTRHYTQGRSGQTVQYLVYHYNDGDLTTEGCYSVWQTREASAHYQVESDGTVGQLVRDADTAWHAGNWDANTKSIGIECANQGDSITDEAIESWAHLVAALCKAKGLGRPQDGVNLFPHDHFSPTSCPGPLKAGTTYHARAFARAGEWYDAMVVGTDAGEPSAPDAGGDASGEPSGGKLLLDGDAGVLTWAELATQLGLSGSDADGYLSQQYAGNRPYMANVSSAIWNWYRGCPGSPTVRAVQSRIGSANVDGVWGAVDTRQLHAYMSDAWGYVRHDNERFGYATAYNLQDSLNKGLWR